MIVFLLEDDEDIAFIVSENLRGEGYEVRTFSKASEFYPAVEREKPDLVLVDVMLPDFDGFRVARYLKNRPDLREIPLIFITARASEEDRLRGFELGADDYIVKPFSVKELLARVRAVLRRSGKLREEGVFRLGALEVDAGRVLVRLDGRDVKLTPSEFRILKLLLENYGRPVSRERIIENALGLESNATARTVDVHIKHLRDKLERYGSCIKTVRGFGYKFES